ncbi:glycosyltransferase family 4 protein [Paracoccus caeni]|uniref:Glycosyltransferase family 4 protein n=1 Tax=Paracoccus caeni TaxID=657651 RepID=A0A934SFV0_9RHOB|nr:glycosyltransferase family 4 protein [Paracoccus caeni]MBK4218151.1 glycosyltransferase family 4 protein [Paracoccus caeni]
MTRSARIAYLTGEYPAVSHTFILREVLALRALGHDIRTCSIRRTGPEHHRGPDEKEAAATTFHVLDAAKNPATLLGALGWALKRPGRLLSALRLALRTRSAGIKATIWQVFYVLEALVLARHCDREGITRIHNHFAMASSTVAMLAAELAGIPYSFTLHGPADFWDTGRWRLDEKIARADFVACISQFSRSQGMLFADPRHWPRLHIIHCGIEPDRYAPDPARPAGRNVLFIGRLAAAKGVPVLLEAFAGLHATFPDARLTLIGDGPARADLTARAAELGIADAVRFTGYLNQDEVAAELARCDLFALPSFAEGVPVVLMEAMASRRPVLATRIAGIPELVEDGVSGRIVAPGDIAGFATAMTEVLADPEAARRMGEAGQRKVATEFNQRLEAEKLGRLFEGGTDPHR